MVRPVTPDRGRAAEAYAGGWWVPETLADALRAAARDTPQRVAVADGAVRLDCRQMYRSALRLATALARQIPAGSVVSFMLPNWYEAAVVYHAVTLAGMVANPLLPSLRDRELGFILRDAGIRMIFIPEIFNGHDYPAMLQRVTAGMPDPPAVVVVRGADHRFEQMLDTEPSPGLPDLDPDAVRMLLYTSGTSGRPKGVLHSHNSIHALIRQIGRHWHVEPGDTFLVASPIAHIGGSIYAFESPLLLGTTAVLMERWNADEAVALIDTQRCTHMAGATPFLDQLLAAARRAGSRLPTLKVFICGGASVPPALIRAAADYFEHAVVTRVYGSTEVPVSTVGAPEPGEADQAAETDGRPGIAAITIAGHPGAPPGTGEIRVRGPQMLLGYLHPEDDADAFDADGYFCTGDLGRWSGEHYLEVTGRAKDIIIRNGENIAPKEIEDILFGHPHIADVAVVAVPDPRTGERACAVLVTDGQAAPTVEELREFLLAQGLAKFKAPEAVVIVDALPKNTAGKVLKHEIQANLRG